MKVGEISNVQLHDGVALVSMDVQRDKLPVIYGNATMLLRPKTGLNDMSVQLDPGTPAAPKLKDGATLPESRTTPNVNPDEFLAALDSDTRAWLVSLLSEGGRGLDGRGLDLRRVLRAGAPTLEATKRVTAALSGRRHEIARLVHDLSILSKATGRRDLQLGRLVDQSDATFAALGSQDGALRASLDRLPHTLATTRAALADATGFANRLGPTLTSLLPTARRLPATLRAASPLLAQGEPILRTKLRPLVRESRPLVTDLAPATRDLTSVTPSLITAFHVLNYVVNELAYNPAGKEEGYLFWTAWFAHNASSILSIQDAQGVAWRGQALLSCSSYGALPKVAPLLQLFIAPNPACPKDPTP